MRVRRAAWAAGVLLLAMLAGGVAGGGVCSEGSSSTYAGTVSAGLADGTAQTYTVEDADFDRSTGMASALIGFPISCDGYEGFAPLCSLALAAEYAFEGEELKLWNATCEVLGGPSCCTCDAVGREATVTGVEWHSMCSVMEGEVKMGEKTFAVMLEYASYTLELLVSLAVSAGVVLVVLSCSAVLVLRMRMGLKGGKYVREDVVEQSVQEEVAVDVENGKEGGGEEGEEEMEVTVSF